MPKFKVTVTGYGGEYAAMKSSYDGLSELVKLYDEDSFGFLDKVDESSEEHYHCVFVLLGNFEIEVTNTDTGEVIDSSNWDREFVSNSNIVPELNEGEYCICSFFSEKGTFLEFEVEDDEFHFDKLQTKEIETWDADGIIGFKYGDEEFNIGDDGYDTTGKGMNLYIINSEHELLDVDDFREGN